MSADTGGPIVSVRALHVGRVELEVLLGLLERDEALELLLAPDHVIQRRDIRVGVRPVQNGPGASVGIELRQAHLEALRLELGLHAVLDLLALIRREVGATQVQLGRVCTVGDRANDRHALLGAHVLDVELAGLDRHVRSQSISLTEGEHLTEQCQAELLLGLCVVLRGEPLLTLVAFLDLARRWVDIRLHRTGGQRVAESISDRAALGVLLHDLPRVAVVAIHADVELVDERVLKHHALKVVDRREHHVVGLRQVARVTHRSLLLGLRHQLGVGVGRILPAHRVDERQGGDRILKAPEDFHRIAVLEEALHAQQRGKELLRDEVHPRHRAAFEAQLLAVHGHLEERRDDVADNRDVVHEDRVHVAEVVRDVARIIEVRRSLEAGDPPATTVLLVLTGQAEAADHHAEGEQAGEADARLHEGVRHVDRFEHLAHVVHLLARGGGVVTGDRVDCLGQAGHQRALLPAVQRGRDERIHTLQAEQADGGVDAVVREHELQPRQRAGDRHCHPWARGERIERPLPEQADRGGLHTLHVGDRVERHLVQRLHVPLDPGGVVHQLESNRLWRGIGQPLHRADIHQHGLDVAASHLVRAHAVVGILNLAGEGCDLGEPSLDLAR